EHLQRGRRQDAPSAAYERLVKILELVLWHAATEQCQRLPCGPIHQPPLRVSESLTMEGHEEHAIKDTLKALEVLEGKVFHPEPRPSQGCLDTHPWSRPAADLLRLVIDLELHSTSSAADIERGVWPLPVGVGRDPGPRSIRGHDLQAVGRVQVVVDREVQ